MINIRKKMLKVFQKIINYFFKFIFFFFLLDNPNKISKNLQNKKF